MKSWVAAGVCSVALLATPSAALTYIEASQCILESAKHLPNIPGLVIDRSEARQDGSDDRPSRGSRMFDVAIYVSAAGTKGVYHFLCGGVPGMILVEPYH
jgi:hypothetical protein